MMNLEDFREDFLQNVKSSAATDKDFWLSAFVRLASEYLAEANEITNVEECHFVGTGSRQRSIAINGFSWDESDDSVRILIAEWRGTEATQTLTQTEVTKILAKVQAFIDDAIAGRLSEIEESHPAHQFSAELFENRATISKIRIYLITDCVLSDRIKDWPEGAVRDIPVESHIWDISRFHRVSESASGRDDLVINFDTFHAGGIAALHASSSAEQHKSYLCVIPGKTLAAIYNEYGSRLLEGNVRSFLSLRGKVNKAVRETILNEPKMFFAFNNGITAVASQISTIDDVNGLKLVWAKDLQIVNGGQTTASLALAARVDKADLDDVLVQMKLSVIPPEISADIIPRISRYANSQNKVSDADFFSNHEFHRRIEECSRRIWAPAVSGAQHETHWFYERARGQYITEQTKLTKSERKKFEALNPKNQLLTKTDLAKIENSWIRLPYQVSKGAQKNFIVFAEGVTRLWESRNDAFGDDYFRRVVARAIMFRSLERIIPAQSWYDGGYRANIVTYSIAKLSEMIHAGGRKQTFDFEGIWRKQEISRPLTEQLTFIARAVHAAIAKPPAGTRNISEWCKKESCWEKISQMNVPMNKSFEAELITEHREVVLRRESHFDQAMADVSRRVS